ncbi:MAG TPA: MiaB/RimO family radical SAM methylthiotransferase, partial [Candidatus Eisenbacteria bacterium]
PGIRAWVTAQRGCDKFCTYCVVPYTRGRERSLPLADLVAQVRRAAASGYREIVFLGQTVNSWRDGPYDFADLLRAAAEVEGVLRLRYTSPHPSDVSERLIDAHVTSPQVCPHVHLPLQSASDRVLEAMNRTYTVTRYLEVAARLRARIPGVALSTDIIVGFPGETEEDFALTVAHMRAMRYDSAFLFKYSARPDTKSGRWPETVSEEEKGRRLQVLVDLQHAISGEINDGWIGREVEVLVEGPARRDPSQLYGRAPQFKAVVCANDGAPAGTLRRVRIVGATPVTLFGEPVTAPRNAAATLVRIG